MPFLRGCYSIIPVHTPSFHLFPARCLGCAPTGHGWPRRCHGKHASSLARPALSKQEAAAPVVMYLAVVSRSCDIQNWSHAGLRVVGVDGHLTAKECLGIKSITCRINRPSHPRFGKPCYYTVVWNRVRRVILPAPIPDVDTTSAALCVLPSPAVHKICRVWVVLAQEWPGLDAFHKHWSIEHDDPDQKSAWAKCGIYQMWGSKAHGGISTPHMSDAPDAGVENEGGVTRRYLCERGRLVRLGQILGRAAARPWCRHVAEVPLCHPGVRILLSAQWRGSLWWAPMTPFSSRSPCL